MDTPRDAYEEAIEKMTRAMCCGAGSTCLSKSSACNAVGFVCDARAAAEAIGLKEIIKALDRVTEPAKRFSAEKDGYEIPVTLGAMRKARATLSQKGGT